MTQNLRKWRQCDGYFHGGTYPVVAGQWIVHFNNVTGTPAQQVQAVQNEVARLGAGITDLRQLGTDGLILLQAPAATTYDRLCVELNGMADCGSIEPNFDGMSATAVPNDPLFGSQWALRNTGQVIGGQAGTAGADINATAAWDLATGS
jgi:hypothetical protein